MQYAEDNELSINQVMTSTAKWDLQQWENALNEMQLDDTWDNDAINRIKAYGASVGINKAHVISAIVGLGVIRLSKQNHDTAVKRIELDSKQEKQNVVKMYSMTDKQAHNVNKIQITKDVSDSWSRIIWKNNDLLANDLENILNKRFSSGITLQEINDILTPHVNQKQFKPKQSMADRAMQSSRQIENLVRTESARAVDNILTRSYETLGVKYVDILNEPGACDWCVAIASDNPYPLEEAPNLPSDSHPSCRCRKVITESERIRIFS